MYEFAHWIGRYFGSSSCFRSPSTESHLLCVIQVGSTKAYRLSIVINHSLNYSHVRTLLIEQDVHGFNVQRLSIDVSIRTRSPHRHAHHFAVHAFQLINGFTWNVCLINDIITGNSHPFSTIRFAVYRWTNRLRLSNHLLRA